MRHSDVGVATSGLRGSNSWKLGEYVAASRAVVSETLYQEVPGGFEPGRNFVVFETPQECAEAVEGLLADSCRRRRMMEANREYYRRSLRPDALVWNTLQRVLRD